MAVVLDTQDMKKTQNSSLFLVSISAEVFVPHLPIGGVVFWNFDTQVMSFRVWGELQRRKRKYSFVWCHLVKNLMPPHKVVGCQPIQWHLACVLIRIWPTLFAYIVSWSVCRSILTPCQWKEWFCLFVLFELLRTIWSKLHHVASEREVSRLLACLEARSQWYQSQLSCLWSKNWCLHGCQWTQWLLCFWWIGINELPFVVTWRRGKLINSLR